MKLLLTVLLVHAQKDSRSTMLNSTTLTLLARLPSALALIASQLPLLIQVAELLPSPTFISIPHQYPLRFATKSLGEKSSTIWMVLWRVSDPKRGPLLTGDTTCTQSARSTCRFMTDSCATARLKWGESCSIITAPTAWTWWRWRYCKLTIISCLLWTLLRRWRITTISKITQCCPGDPRQILWSPGPCHWLPARSTRFTGRKELTSWKCRSTSHLTGNPLIRTSTSCTTSQMSAHRLTSWLAEITSRTRLCWQLTTP